MFGLFALVFAVTLGTPSPLMAPQRVGVWQDRAVILDAGRRVDLGDETRLSPIKSQGLWAVAPDGRVVTNPEADQLAVIGADGKTSAVWPATGITQLAATQDQILGLSDKGIQRWSYEGKALPTWSIKGTSLAVAQNYVFVLTLDRLSAWEVTGDWLNLRSGPHLTDPAKAQVPRGTLLEARPAASGWMQVNWQGQELFAHKSFLKWRQLPRIDRFDLKGTAKGTLELPWISKGGAASGTQFVGLTSGEALSVRTDSGFWVWEGEGQYRPLATPPLSDVSVGKTQIFGVGDDLYQWTRDGQPVEQDPFSPRGMAWLDGRLHVLTGNQVLVYDAKGRQLDQIRLPEEPGRRYEGILPLPPLTVVARWKNQAGFVTLEDGQWPVEKWVLQTWGPVRWGQTPEGDVWLYGRGDSEVGPTELALLDRQGRFRQVWRDREWIPSPIPKNARTQIVAFNRQGEAVVQGYQHAYRIDPLKGRVIADKPLPDQNLVAWEGQLLLSNRQLDGQKLEMNATGMIIAPSGDVWLMDRHTVRQVVIMPSSAAP